MGLNYSAKIFAAGDVGGRSGHADDETQAVQLSGVLNRLSAEHSSVLGMLPNARLTPLYGTSATSLQPAEAISTETCELAWRAVLDDKVVENAVQGRSMLAVPLSEWAMPGFPGALIVSRPTEGAAFTARDLDAAVEQAHRLSRKVAAKRPQKTVSCGIIVFDSKLRPLMTSSNCVLDRLEPKVRTGLLEDARSRFGRKPKRTASRVRIRDSQGAYQNFRAELRRDLPIADGGAVLTYTLAPRVEDWASLQESDFSADPELQRLIPALHFMINKFASLPGLPQIAQKAKLSPFHFHREFSAKLGISPKHLMLDCQIEHACRQLLDGDVELVQIARSCGFAHQSHFTSRFKQATGLTPTAWRKAMKPAEN